MDILDDKNYEKELVPNETEAATGRKRSPQTTTYRMSTLQRGCLMKEIIKEWSSMYWGFAIQISAFAVLWVLYI